MMAAATLYGLPPTDGAQWWSTDPNLTCTSMHALIYEVPLSSGGMGFACGVTGTFLCLAAGGNWTTSIRVAGPSSGAIGVQYAFYDQEGNPVSLDTVSNSAPASGAGFSVALGANQPSELQILGRSFDSPGHKTTQTGSVFGIFLCADPNVCATVVPQLLYSFVPAEPWSISVPIAWDTTFSFLQPSGISTKWSAAGIQDATHLISFAIRNQATRATFYTVRIYDRNGSPIAVATTPVIQPAGTRGFLLTDVISTALPAGILKVTIEAETRFSALFLQFSGNAATSLQMVSDAVPASTP